MRARRRCMHGKRLRRSPMRKDYDFSNTKTYTGKGTFGEKLAKAVTPENTAKGIAGAVAPVGKLGKVAKAAYNIFTS